MKVLLDECLPANFRHSFPTHVVHTVEGAGFKGMKNGELLRSADAAGYDALLTVDQQLALERPHCVRLAIIAIRSRSNRIADLLPLVNAISDALDTTRPGQTITI